MTLLTTSRIPAISCTPSPFKISLTQTNNQTTTTDCTMPTSSRNSGTVRFNHFDFSFEMILDEPEARKVFRAFCDQVLHNGESLSFIESVEKFKVLKHVDNRHALCRNIIDKFIRPNAPHEINISGEIRRKVEDVYSTFENQTDKHSVSYVPLEIFDEAFISVVGELKQEVFSRFKRSVHLRKFVKKVQRSDPAMLERIAKVAKPSGKSLYNIYPSDIRENYITDLDVKAIEELAVDVAHKWKVIKDHSDFQTFSSVCKYALYDHRIKSNLIERSDDESYEETDSKSDDEETKQKKAACSVTYKITGVLPFSVTQVLNTIANPTYKSYYDNSLANSYQLDYSATTIDSESYSTSITLDSLPLPWPINCRDFVTANSIIRKESRDGKEIFFVLKRSILHDQAPVRRGTVRADVMNGWILEKVKDCVTRYTFVEWSDMKFNDLTASYYSKVTKKRFNVMHESLLKALNKNCQVGFPEPTFSYGLIETLAELQDKQKVLSLKNTHINDTEFAGIKRIAYLSRFTKPLSSEELRQIGQVSVKNNQPRSITGMLLCAGGIFYQVVEGLPEDIEHVYNKILVDKRHTDIRLVKEEFGLKESERQFPNWSMNTVNLDDRDDYFSMFMKKLITVVSEMDHSQEKEEELMNQVVGSASQVFSEADFVTSTATVTIAATEAKPNNSVDTAV